MAASIAAVLALSVEHVSAASSTFLVANCNDDGIGSLRKQVSLAGDGDIVDLSHLGTGNEGCAASVITLSTGAIVIGQNSLKIIGPVSRISIQTDASALSDRIFKHTGTGTLDLEQMDITGGIYYGKGGVYARGGCIYSAGSVTLVSASVSYCLVRTSGKASGGGVFATGDLTFDHSRISGNLANTGSWSRGYGGGAYVKGDFSARYSTIAGNAATAQGGALQTWGKVHIASSTISGNNAEDEGGLSLRRTPGPLSSATITNSTISGNSARNVVGGIRADTQLSVYGSTIAFNTAGAGQDASTYLAPGLAAAYATSLQNTLISYNTFGATEFDFSSRNSVVSGSNNLIRVSTGPVPADTSTACPLLGPLRDNGGPTLTHALASGSPAIDQGVATSGVNYDQRGSLFTRVSGTKADIGAYEVQQDDVLMSTSFEGCG
ncbi:MAG TPA: choice-of-anchor Q domain-containing protein [Rudaea sp.]|nr:choice-of-anchor Q domain-containing protein [Rudaea sp.]